MSSDSLIATVSGACARLFPEHHILAAYAYGSRIAGRPRPDSDLDIGYYLSGYREGERLPVRTEMLLAVELAEAVGLEVDLRNLGEASLELRGRILEEGVRVYSGHAAARVGLERDLLGRYHDYKSVFLRMHELRLRRIAGSGL